MAKKTFEISRYMKRSKNAFNRIMANSTRKINIIFRQINTVKGFDNHTNLTIIEMIFIITMNMRCIHKRCDKIEQYQCFDQKPFNCVTPTII